MPLPLKKYPTTMLITVEQMLIKWISHKNNKGDYFFHNHDLDDCKVWIEDTYERIHNVSTIEIAFRKLREDKKVESKDVSLPSSREKRWYVISSLK